MKATIGQLVSSGYTHIGGNMFRKRLGTHEVRVFLDEDGEVFSL